MDTLTGLQQPHFHLGSHVTQVCCCCFSPDGSTILSGSWDKTLKLWRKCDGSFSSTFSGGRPRLFPADFVPHDFSEVLEPKAVKLRSIVRNDKNRPVPNLLVEPKHWQLRKRVPVPLDLPGATGFVAL